MYFRWSDSEAQDWAQVIAAYKAAKAGGSSEKGHFLALARAYAAKWAADHFVSVRDNRTGATFRGPVDPPDGALYVRWVETYGTGPGQLPAGAVEYIIWIKRAEKAQIPAWACPVCGGTVQADWDGERWTWPAVLHPFCAAGG